MSLTTYPKADFSFEISGDIKKCDLKNLYDEVCQHLKNPHNSANKYFPHDYYMILQNHAQVKNAFTVHDRPMDFNVREYKIFMDIISDFILQLVFKKLPFEKQKPCENGYSIKE